MKKTLFIGIAGGSGSGKSTVANTLKLIYPGQVTILHHDDYYKAQHEKSFEERAKTNYDAPEAFDTALLLSHIDALKAGQSVECPVYDYRNHDRSENTVTISPSPIIILDGILVLENEALRNQMDIKLYVDADADERLLRRISRDTRERNRTLESITAQYLSTVKPMHEKYVEPSKKYADLVINRGGENHTAILMLAAFMKNYLE